MENPALQAMRELDAASGGLLNALRKCIYSPLLPPLRKAVFVPSSKCDVWSDFKHI